MHSIYTTPGFIIDSRPYGEAGKILSLFTLDFGLVSAVAQGIRLEKSKLRYFAQDHSLGEFSLVRGKEFWRLTGARAGARADTDNGANDDGWVSVKSEIVARVGLLLKRLLQGEDPHPELFVCVESLLRFLEQNQGLNGDEFKALESLTVFRILRNLGYVGDDDSLSAVVDPKDITREILRNASAKRIVMNRHINKALKESHL